MDSNGATGPVADVHKGVSNGNRREANTPKIWSNVFELGDWPKDRLQHYKVKFEPELNIRDRMFVWRRLQNRFPYANEFDGDILNSRGLITQEKRIDIANTRIKLASGEVVNTKLTFVERDDPKRKEYINRFYEGLCERLLVTLNYKKVGEGYFDLDHAKEMTIEDCSFMVASGFRPKLMEQDNKIMLTLRNVYQVVQSDSVLRIISKIESEVKQKGGSVIEYQSLVEAELIGSTVITPHNFLTYKIDSIYWHETPDTPMASKNGLTTYEGYHYVRYGLTVSTKDQPLLISNNGNFCGTENNKREPARLIPELCNMLDLNPSMRRNPKIVQGYNTAMAAMYNPDKKKAAFTTFGKQLRSNVDYNPILYKWGLKIQQYLV